MRIFLNSYVDQGGIGATFLELSNASLSIGACKFVVFHETVNTLELRSDSVYGLRLPYSKSKALNLFRRAVGMVKLIRLYNPQCVIAFNSSCLVIALLGRFLTKSKFQVVAMSHVDPQILAKQELFIYRYFGRWVNSFVVPSRYLEKEMRSLLPKQIGISTISNPLPSHSKVMRIATDVTLKFDFVFVGRFEAEKDPLLFLEIARMLPRFSFGMFGDGSLKNEIEKQISLLNISNLSLFSRSSIDEVFRSKPMLIVTSRSESFCLVVLEAAVLGCNSLSLSRAKGACELIADYGIGCQLHSSVTDVNALCREILTAKSLLPSVSETIQRRLLEVFDRDNISHMWKSHLDKIIN